VERLNHVLATGLAKCLNSKEHHRWDEYLSTIVHAYNIGVNKSTGYSPYFLNTGRECSTPLDRTLPDPPAFTGPLQLVERYIYYVQEMQSKLRLGHAVATDNIRYAQSLYNKPSAVQRMLIAMQSSNTQFPITKPLRQHRILPRYFAPGDEVLVFTPSVKKGDNRKLTNMWRGPYVVDAIVNEFTYKLSHSRKTKHKMVHANRLKPYYGPSPYTVAALLSTPIREESLLVPVGRESLQPSTDQEFKELVQVLRDADPDFEFTL